MKCPICKLTINKLIGGGYCPNKNCMKDGKRTKLHSLKNRYITMEDKENVNKLVDLFQRSVCSIHGLNMTMGKQDRMKSYISAYHLMDKTNEFLENLNEPQYTKRINWLDFVTDIVIWIFSETGSFAKKLTSLSNLDGQLFTRAAPHVYTAYRAQLAAEDNDNLVISRNGNNGVMMRETLF